jgi:hypothetical protein
MLYETDSHRTPHSNLSHTVGELIRFCGSARIREFGSLTAHVCHRCEICQRCALSLARISHVLLSLSYCMSSPRLWETFKVFVKCMCSRTAAVVFLVTVLIALVSTSRAVVMPDQHHATTYFLLSFAYVNDIYSRAFGAIANKRKGRFHSRVHCPCAYARAFHTRFHSKARTTKQDVRACKKSIAAQ